MHKHGCLTGHTADMMAAMTHLTLHLSIQGSKHSRSRLAAPLRLCNPLPQQDQSLSDCVGL